MDKPQVPVPITATLAATQRQRNQLADENALLWAHIDQLTAELDQAKAELGQTRGNTQVGGSESPPPPA